ncbi:DUF1128 family protein [Staphylococcus aureus]|nr:DUF1128 family protein [Staphylococcus aureus]
MRSRGYYVRVNQGLLQFLRLKEANEEELTDIYDFVQSRERLSPSEVTAIADALGQLRHD